jgi:hypothetical protein
MQTARSLLTGRFENLNVRYRYIPFSSPQPVRQAHTELLAIHGRSIVKTAVIRESVSNSTL